MVAGCAVGCGSASSPAAPTPIPTGAAATVVSITVSGTLTFATSGQTAQLSAIAAMSDSSTRDVTSSAAWSSSNAAVAAVSSAGVVTTLSAGVSTITATYSQITGSANVSVALAAGQIAACGSFTGPGPFSVIADINVAVINCLRFTSNAGVTLDCQGHEVSSIGLNNVQQFTIRNCRMHAGLNQTLRIISSRQVLVQNSDVLGSVFVSSGNQDVTLDHNTFKWPALPPNFSSFESAEVYLSGGQNTRVVNNFIDGAWDGGLGSTYGHQGCDDGVLLNNEINLVVDGNTIQNVFDAGVEPGASDTPIHATIENNTIAGAGYTGIGGYYTRGWENSIFRNNTVRHSPSLLYFTSSDAQRIGVTSMTLTNCQFTDNTFIDQVALPAAYGGQMTSVFAVNYLAGGLPYTVSGNLVRGNNFGTTGIAPSLQPLAGFIDGGGNICRPGGSLACGG